MAKHFKHIWNSVLVAAIFAAVVAAVSVHAATLTSVNHRATSLEVGNDADQELTFTTGSGVAEGETMLVSFDNSFDTSSINEDDIDVEDDGTDLTTASDCSGAEEAGVSIAADVITVEICAGDGGAIAGGSEVVIKVGENAVDSGLGSNRVGNPSNIGTYQIYISGGTFADWGSAWVPISSPGDVDVTLSIGDDGSGGPSTGCGDSMPPNISNVSVIDITENEATITWETDETADSLVNYGETDSYEIGSETDNSLITEHSIDLTNLTAGTVYHFEVSSADFCLNRTTVGDYTFTTVDLTPPIISNVRVEDITETSARVLWDTNEPANSLVDYGLDVTYGSDESDGTYVTEHSVLLTGLTANTLYHFQVSSTDQFGNSATDGDYTFTTLYDPPPGNVILTVTPGDSQNYLEWVNPSDSDLDGIRIVYRTDSYPTDPTDGTLIYNQLGTEYLHTGLTNGVTYYYAVFAYDLAGQFSSGALGSGTPFADEPICGDAVCEGDESCETCPDDCGECVEEEEEEEDEEEDEDEEVEEDEEEEVDDGGPGEIPSGDVEFYVAKNKIELLPRSGVVRMLVGTELRVQILTRNISWPVDHVELSFGDSLYLMNPPYINDYATGNIYIAAINDDAYYADVITPTTADAYPLEVTVFYEGGYAQNIPFTAQVDAFGYTFTSDESGTKRVGNSRVTLFSNDTGEFIVWDASPYGELNPVTTPADGTFAWYVPIGDYYIVAEAAGYDDEVTADFYVEDNIINPTIELTPLPPPLEEVLETPEQALGIILDNVVFALEEVREVPGIMEAFEITIPILLLLALGNLIWLALFFNLLPFLQYLLSAPILFFWRRKRKGWGVVYNSMTKIPIGLAIVRLFKLSSKEDQKGQLLQSRVTDKEGRYFFLADRGEYRIEVTKPGYEFPSEYLARVTDDGAYLDVYHGEVISVSEKDATIAANIPMDPIKSEKVKTPAKIKFMRWARRIQNGLAVLGVVLAIVVAIIMPTVLTITVAVAQVLLYFLIKRLTRVRKPKGWGIVYDKRTKKPLANVVVRIFEPKYNKLLETTVTDNKGRYSFLVGPNEYFTRYERSGYQPTEYRPIDYKDKDEPTDVAIDVYLDKQNGTNHSSKVENLPERRNKSYEGGNPKQNF